MRAALHVAAVPAAGPEGAFAGARGPASRYTCVAGPPGRSFRRWRALVVLCLLYNTTGHYFGGGSPPPHAPPAVQLYQLQPPPVRAPPRPGGHPPAGAAPRPRPRPPLFAQPGPDPGTDKPATATAAGSPPPKPPLTDDLQALWAAFTKPYSEEFNMKVWRRCAQSAGLSLRSLSCLFIFG